MLDDNPGLSVVGNGANATPLRPGALPSKEEMAETLVARGQFLVGEQGKVVRNGLSTDLILFPSDLKKGHEEYLQTKVEDAIEYAAEFVDVERLNALLYVPGARFGKGDSARERWYLTLGLYLYFADECSRADSSTTFLGALRQADAALAREAEFNQKDLYQKVKRALRIAKIATPENCRILDEWASHESYTIGGEKHYGKGDGDVSGLYAALAKEILREYHHLHLNGKCVGINEAISYALGNKPDIVNLSIEDALEKTRESIRHPERIKEKIDAGDRERKHVIWDEIQKAFPQSEIEKSRKDKAREKEVVGKILRFFPSETLELILRERYSFVYDDAGTIKNIYPKGKIPGSSDKFSEECRTCKAVRSIHYRTMFVSNGEHDPKTSEELKYERVAQTVLHETMHMALDHLSEAERDKLYAMADKVSEALRQGDDEEVRPVFPYHYLGDSWGKDRILESMKLAEILDFRSQLYDGYKTQYASNKKDSPDMRREEVLCNIFGLLHTEYANSQDTNNPLFFPVSGISIVRDFTVAVEEAYKKGVQNLRAQQEAKGIGLPTAAQSRTVAA